MKHPAATLALAAGIPLAAACPWAPAAIAGPGLAGICEGGGGLSADRFYKNCQRLDPPQVRYEYILGSWRGATVMIELLGEGRQLFCPPTGHGTPARARYRLGPHAGASRRAGSSRAPLHGDEGAAHGLALQVGDPPRRPPLGPTAGQTSQ